MREILSEGPPTTQFTQPFFIYYYCYYFCIGILFLDEPTSGLDSMTAHNLIITLKHVANMNRTVVVTIHQPRTDIFNMLDDIMLLSGECVHVRVCVRVCQSVSLRCHSPSSFVLL